MTKILTFENLEPGNVGENGFNSYQNRCKLNFLSTNLKVPHHTITNCLCTRPTWDFHALTYEVKRSSDSEQHLKPTLHEPFRCQNLGRLLPTIFVTFQNLQTVMLTLCKSEKASRVSSLFFPSLYVQKGARLSENVRLYPRISTISHLLPLYEGRLSPPPSSVLLTLFQHGQMLYELVLL